MKAPAAIASIIAAVGALLAAPEWIALVLASLAGDSARIAEIGASMIEGAVYASIAAAVGLSVLGGLGGPLIKALASE